jgi:hypothetical protein
MPRGIPADTVRLLRVLQDWTNVCDQQPQGILMAGFVALTNTEGDRAGWSAAK